MAKVIDLGWREDEPDKWTIHLLPKSDARWTEALEDAEPDASPTQKEDDTRPEISA